MVKRTECPFWNSTANLQAFQLYKVIVEMDKKLMLYEERDIGRDVISSLLSVVLYQLKIQVHSLFQSYKLYYVVKDCIDKICDTVSE